MNSKMGKFNLDVLKEAILEYREEGKKLMIKLGEKYGYNILVPEEYEELIWRSNLQ